VKLLFVDDDEQFLRAMTTRLTLRGFQVASFSQSVEARKISLLEQFDVAMIDLKMPGLDGEDLLQILKQAQPLLEVVILTGHGTIKSAVECTRTGAYDYLQKPCEFESLLKCLANAFAKRLRNERKENIPLVDEIMAKFGDSGALELLKSLQQINRE
jgi:DNA-binding NtrC family response regulator